MVKDREIIKDAINSKSLNSYEKEVFLNDMISKDIEFFNRNYEDAKAQSRNLRFICRAKEKAIRNKKRQEEEARLQNASAQKSDSA